MIHVRSIDEISLQDSWLTIGVFDGVHRGHQEVMQRLTSGAKQAGAPAVVVTFWPHPATVVGGGRGAVPDHRRRTRGAAWQRSEWMPL